jgi:hypothetical protein
MQASTVIETRFVLLTRFPLFIGVVPWQLSQLMTPIVRE